LTYTTKKDGGKYQCQGSRRAHQQSSQGRTSGCCWHADPILGERVCAFIKPKKDATISFEEIISYLKGKKTSALYLPERIEIIEEMPLTNVGKVDKRRLKEEMKEKLKKEGKI